MRKSPRYLYYAGLAIFIISLFITFIALATGFIGIMIHCTVGDLIYVGNPKLGPGIAFALIVEGFIFDLAPSIGTAFLGYFIKISNTRAVENLANSRPKLKDKKNVEGFIRLLKSQRKGKMTETTDTENGQDISKTILLEEDDPKFVQKYRNNITRYVKESPKYLFLFIFLTVAINLGMALTCYLMSKGLGTAGMMDVTKRYLTEKRARMALDWVQQKGECCGEQVFTEWFSMKWCMETKERPPTEYNLENFNICPPEHRTVKFDVPSSCCSPNRTPCIHDALDVLGLGPLNMEGCRKYMNGKLIPLYKTLAWYHVSICLLKFILMILVFAVRPSAAPQGEDATEDERSHLIQGEESSKTRPKASVSLTSFSGRPSEPPARATLSLGQIPPTFQDFDDTDIMSSTQNPTPTSSETRLDRKSSISSLENSDGVLRNEDTGNGVKRFSSDSIELENISGPAQIVPSLQRTESSSFGNARTD